MSHKTISDRKIGSLVKRDGINCHYCGTPLTFDNWKAATYRTADHIDPQIKGGDHNINNLVLACRSCNSSKHARHYQEFKMSIDTDATLLFLMGDES